MKSWLTILIDRAVWGARLPFVKLKALDARIVRALEAWDPWPCLRRRKPKKRRKHGPGWISPKAVAAAIRAEIVPIALARGWTPLDQVRARKGNSRFGEFFFERVGPSRVQFMGVDFAYGETPDVWISGVSSTGSGGVCTERRHFHCVMGVGWRKKRSYLRAIGSLFAKTPPRSLPEAVARGFQCLEIIERFLDAAAPHPDLLITPSKPPYNWPDGYADKVR
ncbi:MAG: hypothetical protein AB1942_17020 [Pseudomonadota bacterium]